MTTYFIHDHEGVPIGWIDAVDLDSARMIAGMQYDQNVTISTRPEGEWYIRTQVPPETQALAFTA